MYYDDNVFGWKRGEIIKLLLNLEEKKIKKKFLKLILKIKKTSIWKEATNLNIY